MDGSQAQRRKSTHRTLHTLISPLLPQHWSSSAAACHSLDRTQRFLRNPGFGILLQGEARSVSCSARSCDVCPQKSPAGLLTQPGNSLSENREHGMIKGVWQELFAPFFTLPASSSSSVVWAWILSKPSVAESLCQFLLAPSSSCGLGSSTRKLTPYLAVLLLWVASFVSRGMWSCSKPPRGHRGPSCPTLGASPKINKNNKC